jgi:hypothetical protein
MRWGFVWVALAVVSAGAEDSGLELRNAAKKGQAAQVAELLRKGASIESADKNGRTPLILAAERGHADVVKLLLDGGAKPDARDRDGWNAYGRAVIENREDVVKLFPRQDPIAVALDVKLAPDNVYNSCLMKPDALADHIAGLQPDMQVAAAVSEYAALNGRGLVRVVESGPQVTLTLKVRPSVSCLQQQTRDNISLAIDARLVRAADQAVLLEKTFGGGLKGLRARTVSSPAQYAPLFSEWAKSHAPGIYWAAVEAWLRAR